MFKFKIKATYRKARLGSFSVPYGKIQTPNMAIVATHGKIKLLNKTDHSRANPNLIISNTFHLLVSNKVKEIKKAGGLHKWTNFKKPIMTDSGGFQVFSLGWGKVHKIGKVSSIQKIDKKSKNPVKISEKGVIFKYNNKKFELTPEKTMEIQKDIGADIIFAFDECTSPFHNHSYTKKSMERTHRWAVRCLQFTDDKRLTTYDKKQSLFGIVQGGIFEDLRRESSKFIGALPFEGFGIGGSFGEKQMKEVLEWSLNYLPEDKPRHLLGIGKIKDIFIAVKQGIDLFDCVIPTREARHGVLYVKSGKLSIERGIFNKDKKLIEKGCGCFVCKNKINRGEIFNYFKNRDKKEKGQRLATIHNIYFYKRLFQEIRQAIADKKLSKLEKEYSAYL